MGNRRNGKIQKQVKAPLGEVTVSTPSDRNSNSDPQFIKKREIILAEGVTGRIISLYALGNAHMIFVKILVIVYRQIQSALLQILYFRK